MIREWDYQNFSLIKMQQVFRKYLYKHDMKIPFPKQVKDLYNKYLGKKNLFDNYLENNIFIINNLKQNQKMN